MDVPEAVAGRAYARVYTTSRRNDLHEYLAEAVRRSGGRLLYASDANRAPVYMGIEAPSGERIGVLCYPFRATANLIKNRPSDEHRLQIRYGAEGSWSGGHALGRDIAHVDTTLVLGVHLGADLLVGLDPNLYDPIPMGISIEFKQGHVDEAQEAGWHVFERDNISGRRRPSPRASQGLETVLLFKPDRLLDYIRLERKASDLGLDPALRFKAAEEAQPPGSGSERAVASVHDLEVQFEMTSNEILQMISSRTRLNVAVRGGVAEHHLYRVLSADDDVVSVKPLDVDGKHDFDIMLGDGRKVRVECKNASPKRYADGDMKVEVQKTRATQGDPAGRLYRYDQFDVIAACLFAPTGRWSFAYRSTDKLERHRRYPERLAPLQKITCGWASTLMGAV